MDHRLPITLLATQRRKVPPSLRYQMSRTLHLRNLVMHSLVYDLLIFRKSRLRDEQVGVCILKDIVLQIHMLTRASFHDFPFISKRI